MRITILTLFPDMFNGPFDQSILKRAQDVELHQGKAPVEIKLVNIRDFATDKHKVTDDRPYGGGPGMVMKIEPIDLALQSLAEESKPNPLNKRVILTSAKGRLFNQQIAQQYSQLDELVIVCGHYEGVDERVAEHLIDEEIRIGDYVLTGGEPAAIVIVDAVTRLLPKVLGNENSNQQESHSQPNFFAAPQYTRPEVYKDWQVPEILLSGNHKQIEEWKKEQSNC